MSQTLGLPGSIRACLFDLDGVLTQTASVHAAAWKEMFDAFLRSAGRADGAAFVPFDAVADYDEYVDGKPRYDGVRSFLASRGIELPEGEPSDPPSAETVRGLGNRKNELVLALIQQRRRRGLRGLGALRAGRRATPACAARSSPRAPTAVTCSRRPGIEELFEARIDGVVAEREHLQRQAGAGHVPGRRARRSGSQPERGRGVRGRAGRASRQGARAASASSSGSTASARPTALRAHGADIVVSDLAELLDAQ